MRRMLLAVMVLGSAQAIYAQAMGSGVRVAFQAARALSITGITAPILSQASGTVVLDAAIDEYGNVKRVDIRRDIAYLSRLAVSSVEKWKFYPATLAGKPIVSEMPVAVTFRPPGLLLAPNSLPPRQPGSGAEPGALFQPARVIHAVFPDYPGNTVASGSVVLEVNLSATGKAQEVTVLRDLPPLTAAAELVVGQWRFTPATYDGKPVPSRIVLAFVSSPLVS